MSDELASRVLRQYGVAPVQLLPMQKGYRNESHAAVLVDGRTLNLILYKREPDILTRMQHAHYVADFLAPHGFPVRTLADRRIMQMRAGNITKYAALYKYLPGETILWEAYTMAHIKLLGQTMSDMHAALAQLPPAQLPHVADEYLAILTHLQSYFSEPGVQDAMRRKLGLAVRPATFDKYKKLVQAAKQLPSQPLHMDFVRGNLLFQTQAGKPKLSGILDFEKAAAGPPAFDIARTLAFLLVDCKYKEPEKVRKYFLHSGYNKQGEARFANFKLLDALTTMFLLHDFYKFLRHNPYEFLRQNEHYVRTKALLLDRGLLGSSLSHP